MSYRIDYSADTLSKSTRQPSARLRLLIVAFLLAFFLLFPALCPEGAAWLRETLLPWDPTVTEQAFQEMISTLKQGEPAGNALSAFCREILDYDEYAIH